MRALNPMTSVFTRELQREVWDTEKTGEWDVKTEQRLRWWDTRQGSQRWPMDTRSWERQRSRDSPLEPPEGPWLCWNLEFRLRPPELWDNKSVIFFSHPLLGNLLEQSQETSNWLTLQSNHHFVSPLASFCRPQEVLLPIFNMDADTNGQLCFSPTCL